MSGVIVFGTKFDEFQRDSGSWIGLRVSIGRIVDGPGSLGVVKVPRGNGPVWFSVSFTDLEIPA